MSAAPRSTIILGPSLREIRRSEASGNFSARLESVAGRYNAIIADMIPKSLTIADWRTILPILQSSTFAQPGDVFLITLRLKAAGSSLGYKLETMKLAELIAIVEAGQTILANHTEPSDKDILEQLKARA